jgi:hypothetical protein
MSGGVPPSKRVQIRDAKKLYSDFTGHKAEIVDTIPRPEIPDVLIYIGECDGLLYTTVRDGKTERYIHEFNGEAKPEFCVSPDGRQIFLIGGLYKFTERGIVDQRKKR